LLEDNENIDRVWDIFYHFKIDDRASKILTRQSQRLYNSAQTIKSWRESRYNSFLKMVDTRTLAELRSHWKSYADFSNLPANRLNRLLKEQSILSTFVREKYGSNLSSGRSAGMLWPEAMSPVSQLFQKYWETGTTFTRASDIKSARHLNPTFVYSLSGEAFNPHYGTFPQGFHLIPAFAPIAADPAGPLPNTGSAVINVAKQQFKAWCNAFQAARSAGSITIRFYAGDAIAFCHALNMFSITGQPATNIFVSAWRAPQINFDELSTSIPRAPTTFDVIDTSNLTDHLGLLNLLIATQPLLKQTPVSQSVLYTETLLPSGEDATRSLLERICTNVPTIATLFGIAPRPYLSAFTSQSNVHEIVFSDRSGQYHERVSWASPSGGDHHACANQPTITFEAEDLARTIFGIYDNMFANEKHSISAFLAGPSLAKLRMKGMINFQRETVAFLFRVIQNRVHLRNGDWGEVVEKFLDLVITSRSRLIEPNNYQDLCLQLHLHGIYTVVPLQPDWHIKFRASPRANIIDDWPIIPSVVCVVLTVPRKRLEVLHGDPERIGSPILQCYLRVDGSHDNTYAALHAVWGRCIVLPGTDKAVIREDPLGINGKSDLIVSFWTNTRVLEFPQTKVALGIKSTPQSTLVFAGKLGMLLEIFSASLSNKQHVRLLSYRPTLESEASQTLPNTFPRQSAQSSKHLCQALSDKYSNHQIDSFSFSFKVESPAERESLLKGGKVSVTQLSPCTMELTIGKLKHLISFPYPIQGSNHKLRIARQSHEVEVRYSFWREQTWPFTFVNRLLCLCPSPWTLPAIFQTRSQSSAEMHTHPGISIMFTWTACPSLIPRIQRSWSG
jgi:hypothetical protein